MKKMKFLDAPLQTMISLVAMIREMSRKGLELKRITKTAALLVSCGLSSNSLPPEITERCLREQQPDGGWVATVDTMWNAFFLKTMDETVYRPVIENALGFIRRQENDQGLWGRSRRDMSRIPVTGILFYLFPGISDEASLHRLEQLWIAEKNSLTYKAGYTLMAFSRCGYRPKERDLIQKIAEWLLANQEEDGGFSPWKGHPVDADVYCTSISLLGLSCYPGFVPKTVFESGFRWLMENRLEDGRWKYHELEDGASWGLYALTEMLRSNLVEHG